ncbi:MAG: hypothetical protein RL653_157, partial [Pseudomonadota bacterium]
MSSRTLFLGLLLGALSASAQRTGALEGRRIAVLEFQSGKGVALQAPETLSDECRGGVVDVVRGEGALVLTRENMAEVLKATGGKCVEGECEVETARNLGVAYFVTGAVANVDGRLMLTLKVFETRTGAMLGQERISAVREGELIDQAKAASAGLVRAAFGVKAPRGVKAPQAAQLGSFGEAGKDVSDEDGDEVLAKFESDPAGATVRLDGALLCKSTPCSKRVPGGRHEVVFEQERYSAATLDAVIGKGAVVRGTLQPRFGWLTIDTDVPGVTVSVDGAPVGKSPVSAREVDVGTVEVAVADGCFVRSGERIAIQGGERRTVKLAARARVAGLKVNAVDEKGNDLEAIVLVDGTPAGEAGSLLKVPACSRSVTVKSSVGTWAGQVELEEGEVKTVTAKVSSAPGSAGGDAPVAAASQLAPVSSSGAAAAGEVHLGMRASFLAMPLSTANVFLFRVGMFTWTVDAEEAADGWFGGVDADIALVESTSDIDLYGMGLVAGYAKHLGGAFSVDGSVRGCLAVPEDTVLVGLGVEAGLGVSLASNFLVRAQVEALKWSGSMKTIGADYH